MASTFCSAYLFICLFDFSNAAPLRYGGAHEEDQVLDIRTVSPRITFGGQVHVEELADKQTGPTCGFEAIAHVIGLFHRGQPGLVNQYLIPRSSQLGVTGSTAAGPVLELRGYIPLLNEYSISAQWYPFNHQHVVLPALQANRAVLAIGDALFLNRQLYPKPGSWHAVVVTNYYVDASDRFILGYIGVDSNVPHSEVGWSYESLGGAVNTAGIVLKHPPLLISDYAAPWPTARFYRLLSTGTLTPVA